MALMCTREDVLVSAEQKVHRRRVIELSEQYGSDVTCEDAIVEIMRTLMVEGFYIDINNIDDQIQQVVEDQIPKAERSNPNRKLIMLYHIFICETNTAKSWTVPRNPGECRVQAYLPRLLQVTKMKLSAETEVFGQDVQFPETDLKNDISKHITDPFNWKEVSILEYVNAHLPNDDRVVGPRSQSLVQVITNKEDNVSWREAQDHDKQKGEDIFVNNDEEDEEKCYVRSQMDVRRLYEVRPKRMAGMSLGQFAAEFRRIKAGGCGFENANSKINPETDVGPDSDGRVVGMVDIAAPQCMKLSNGTVMLRRGGRPAVLHLLYSGVPGRFGHELLWEPWQYLEDVKGNQSEEETQGQKSTRLAIFDMSVYPGNQEDDDNS